MTTLNTQSDAQTVLRQSLRAVRRDITGDTRAKNAMALVEQLHQLTCVKTASRIATFLSIPEEIDTHYLNNALFHHGKSLYLPVVVGRHQALKFAPYAQDTRLIRGQLDILVPDVDESTYIDGSDLDSCFVPLVGFDANGNRIGMGGGFYDRSFAFLNTVATSDSTKPSLIGVAYDAQRVDAIARNEWDVKLDELITPTTHYDF